MTALGALVGAAIAGGMLLILLGLRSAELSVRKAQVRAPVRPDRVALRVVLGVGAGAVVGATTGWVVGAVLGAAAAAYAPSFFGATDARRLIDRTEAVATWTEMLRDTLAGAGAHLSTALKRTEGLAPPPIRAQVDRLVADLWESDVEPEDALRHFANDLADPTADLVVSALVLAFTSRTKDLAALLGALASAARSEATMRIRVESEQARTRTSVRILSLMSFVFLAGMALLSRDYVAAYDTPVGQVVLGLIGAWCAMAYFQLQKLSRPVSPQRFLAPAPTETAG